MLLLIFSHSLSHGVISDAWKRAAVIPIYKSGDITVPSNYRPISLTSVICKVLERIIRKQICSFLDQNGCFNSTQQGFRSGRSCLSALVDVFHNIMHMLDNYPSVDMVYLDFSKAFHKVDHGIHLHKLSALGLSGNIGFADIDKDVSASKLISLVDDTRLYSGVGDVSDCDNQQFDIDNMYDWASSNNMFF